MIARCSNCGAQGIAGKACDYCGSLIPNVLSTTSTIADSLRNCVDIVDSISICSVRVLRRENDGLYGIVSLEGEIIVPFVLEKVIIDADCLCIIHKENEYMGVIGFSGDTIIGRQNLFSIERPITNNLFVIGKYNELGFRYGIYNSLTKNILLDTNLVSIETNSEKITTKKVISQEGDKDIYEISTYVIHDTGLSLEKEEQQTFTNYERSQQVGCFSIITIVITFSIYLLL